MQRQMEEATKELEEKEVSASAGGGAVEVTVSGKKEVVKVKLAEEVVDPDDIEMLEDLHLGQDHAQVAQLAGIDLACQNVGQLQGLVFCNLDLSHNNVHLFLFCLQ